MSDVIVLAIPVALACAIVAVLVVALMKYNRCPSSRITVCCPDRDAECCRDNCPKSVIPNLLLAGKGHQNGNSQMSLNSKEDSTSLHSGKQLHTPASFFSSSSRTGKGSTAGSTATASGTPPPPQGMYRTQYKRVSIRPPSSSDESEGEGGEARRQERRPGESSPRPRTPDTSSGNAFQFPPVTSSAGWGGNNKRQRQQHQMPPFVETHPVTPTFTSGIPVQNSPPVPPSQFRPTGDGKVCSEGTEDQLTVSILDLQSASEECNIAKEGSRVTLMVLPDKKFKFKTPVAKANTFPILFKKSFSFAVGNEIDILNTSLRFRVYSCESILSKSVLICQRLVRLEDLPLPQDSSSSSHYSSPYSRSHHSSQRRGGEGGGSISLDLFAPADEEEEECMSNIAARGHHNKTPSRSSSLSRKSSEEQGHEHYSPDHHHHSSPLSANNPLAAHRSPPSLLLGLAYNFNTGRLIVEVHRATNLRWAGASSPDSFVTVAMSSKNERKTSTKKSNCSPVFMENFVFEVAMTHLTLCFVKIILFVKQGRTKRKMGGVHLSLNSTSEEIRSHWKQMMHAEGSSIVKWYDLQEDMH
ncbi:uncharacterized protein LOC134851711 [Symsagittifera roscoffensis]|uniref:uncharacterized protein LOC134851711 n=1 Tax=Symsagittifera roscoffensis TaxID=84072 RepID=UPI00307BF0CB